MPYRRDPVAFSLLHYPHAGFHAPFISEEHPLSLLARPVYLLSKDRSRKERM